MQWKPSSWGSSRRFGGLLTMDMDGGNSAEAYRMDDGMSASATFIGPAGDPASGLWFGLIGGYVVTTALAAFAVCRSDWPALAKRAQERAESAALGRAATAVSGTLQEGPSPEPLLQDNDS